MLSNTPIFKNDVLIKIPIVRGFLRGVESVFENRVMSTAADDVFPNLQIGSYWEDNTHPEDKWV